MKVWRVSLSVEARADLEEIADWISERGGVDAALGYVGRIEAFCSGLSVFPHRGSVRRADRPNLRVIGFERRATIGFVVGEDEVTVLRILRKGGDILQNLVDETTSDP